MKKLFATLVITALLMPSAQGATASPTLNSIPKKLVAGQVITLSGKAKPGNLIIQRKTASGWSTIARTKANSKGKWSVKLRLKSTWRALKIRAVSAKKYSKTRAAAVIKVADIAPIGPGGRLLGADVSRWQQQDGDIDYATMRSAGLAFVIMKASDGDATTADDTPNEDGLALKYAKRDVSLAKQSGLYVGFYHRARVPVTNVNQTLVANATKQAKQAAARLTALGGDDEQTLPFALDIEGVSSRVTDASVTLWTQTWLNTFESASGQIPIVYSYRSFLAGRFTADISTELRRHHLWLAQPTNPADATILPGMSNDGTKCFQMAWTLPGCRTIWTFWQYTNSGDREVFGIPWTPDSGTCPTTAKFCTPSGARARKHLDLNVFTGTVADLAALANGTWDRGPLDYQ